MPDFLTQGSLALIYAALLAAGMGMPISEDVVILTTGAMSDRGMFEPYWALLVCYLGVLSGDFMLFSIGRHLGPRMLRMKFFQRILPAERLARTEAMFAKRGPFAVFISRFLIGFRVPGFATAGLLQMSPWKFLAWDALGAALTAPLMFGIGYSFSNQIDEIEAVLGDAANWVAAGVLTVLLIATTVWFVRRRRANAERPLE